MQHRLRHLRFSRCHTVVPHRLTCQGTVCVAPVPSAEPALPRYLDRLACFQGVLGKPWCPQPYGPVPHLPVLHGDRQGTVSVAPAPTPFESMVLPGLAEIWAQPHSSVPGLFCKQLAHRLSGDPTLLHMLLLSPEPGFAYRLSHWTASFPSHCLPAEHLLNPRLPLCKAGMLPLSCVSSV